MSTTPDVPPPGAVSLADVFHLVADVAAACEDVKVLGEADGVTRLRDA